MSGNADIFLRTALSKKKVNEPHSSTNNRSGGKTPASPMDLTLLEQITRLMRENDLNTVDLREGANRVILKRGALMPPGGSSGFATGYAHPAPPPQLAHASGGSSSGASSGASSASTA